MRFSAVLVGTSLCVAFGANAAAVNCDSSGQNGKHCSPSPTSTGGNSEPSRIAQPTGAWVAALAKATATVAKMSLQDKVDMVTGIGWQKGLCVGNIKAIPSINFPGLCLQDSPLGVRFTDFNSVFPAGVNAAATFNRDLITQRGVAMGSEFKGKGVNIALGPDMNLARVPNAGRNWEGFGADPYLSGEAAYATIQGMQDAGVQACAKHYINNEQETNRGSESSVVDDRTEHELYLHPFMKAVQAGVAAVMCSYNQVNGTWSCENDHNLNGMLKTELGFQGFVTTDWWVNMPSGTLAANRGLDMVMPGEEYFAAPTSFFGANLYSAVNNSQVPLTRVNDMVTRILASWYLLGQDKNYPTPNLDSWTSGGQHVNVQGDHAALIRKIGGASTVLLKNTNSALPLAKPRSIGIIGSDAGSNPNGPNSCADRNCDIGILAVGWGSGTANFPYLVDPLSAVTAYAKSYGAVINSSLSDTDIAAAQSAAIGKTVALVFITADSGEGYLTVEGNAGDRVNLDPWHSGNALVQAVASVNPNTIVVVHTVGAIVVDQWVTNPNVTAIVWAGLQGQEAGNSLVDILWGAVNPSGRLPYTIAKAATDYGAAIGQGPTVTYSEGLFIDYRWFDANNIAPRFEFGFGLSYTTFSYGSLHISGPGGWQQNSRAPTGPGSSLSTWLHDSWVTVQFQLKNTGHRDGTEIPQLYVTPPANTNSPKYQLRGFESVELRAGESTQVTIELSRYSFAIWQTSSGSWVIPSGTHGISIGSSSRNFHLTGSIKL